MFTTFYFFYLLFLFNENKYAVTATPTLNARSWSGSLDKSLISNRGDGLGEVVLGGDVAGFTGLDRKSLQDNLDTSLGSFLALASVLLDAVQEFLTALGVLDVLNTDVDALLKVTVANTLVDDDTDGRLGDVVNDTGTTEIRNQQLVQKVYSRIR
jgi:hypothetical protein